VNAVIRGLIVASVSVVLVGCGGGGGGGSSAGGNASANAPASSAGPWLTFSPSPVELELLPNKATVFSVKATSTKTIAQAVNIAIIDTKGVIQPTISLTQNSPQVYFAAMTTNAALAPGVYSGQFEVRVCYDAPIACASPVEGSPWQLPYRFHVNDPASLSFKQWEAAQTTPGFLDDFAISQSASVPVVVTAGFYSRVMETWTSADAGTSWTLLTTAHSPTPLTRGFALAGDGSAIYLSGGQGLKTSGSPGITGVFASHVWKFDGSDWTAQTPAASFPPREGHVMAKVGATLYVAGGTTGATVWRDLWRSIDDGVNWSKVLDTLPTALGRISCAVNWQGSLLLVGQTGLATSADGVQWNVRSGLPARFPFGSTQCGLLNNRLVVVAPDGNRDTYSSADLQSWQLEPSPGFATPSPGAAAVAGRLLTVTGSGTSQRTVYRTVP